jgi:lysophospholipase L1-like esterase
MQQTRLSQRLAGRRLMVAALVAAATLVLPAAAQAQPDTGSANFTNYVAVGDSLTAGFASGSLVRTHQVNSYPALIARQARGVTTGFEQPLVSEPGLPAINRLRSLVPLVISPDQGAGSPLNLLLPRPYNNLGVPGADVHDVLATLNGGLHDVVLRNQPGRVIGTQLEQAVGLRPTFVTVWIGNNDVLGAATSGRVIDGVTLTPAAEFEADYRTITSALASTGAKMALATIPDVASIPFVTTLPPVVINPQTNQPVIVNGQPVPLVGVGPGDRVLLTAAGPLGQGVGIPTFLNGTGQPLPDSVVLSAAEIAAIRARTAQYNAVITSVASQRDAALFDASAWLTRVATTGIQVGGVTLTEDFLTGGLFSYDGVHPNAIGYALVANLFIEAINDKFGAEIPPVNLLPFLFGTAGTSSATAASDAAATGPWVHFSHEAWQNLRWALHIPSNAEIDQAIKPRKPRRRR